MARYTLVALVDGVRLEGGISVSQLAAQQVLIKELEDTIAKGGQEALVEFTDDDAAVVTLEIRRSRIERLIQRRTQREADLENDLEQARCQVDDMQAVETVRALQDHSILPGDVRTAFSRALMARVQCLAAREKLLQGEDLREKEPYKSEMENAYAKWSTDFNTYNRLYSTDWAREVGLKHEYDQSSQ